MQRMQRRPEPEVRSWPELTGKTFEEAAEKIKSDCPDVNVLSVPEGSMVTMDFRLDRVRVFVDEQGLVVGVPTTG